MMHVPFAFKRASVVVRAYVVRSLFHILSDRYTNAKERTFASLARWGDAMRTTRVAKVSAVSFHAHAIVFCALRENHGLEGRGGRLLFGTRG